MRTAGSLSPRRPWQPRRRRRRSVRTALALTVCLGLVPHAAAAQDQGDANAGHALAAAWCGSCHAIAPDTAAPVGSAPPFSAIAAMPSTTSLSLAAFLQTPHAQMPDLQLSRNQIDDLSAYILSLRHR